MKNNSLNIDLEVYTGPFDVLLNLIEKQKVDIYDVKIEDITGPYMEAINNMDIAIDQLSEFIYISSILLYIKSSKLMPKEDGEKIEEDFLEYLIEYKKIKSVEDDFKALENEGRDYFYKLKEDLSKYSDDRQEISQDIKILSKEFKKVMESFKNKTSPKENIVSRIKRLDVNDYLKKIRASLNFSKKIRLDSIIDDIGSKAACIGTFLALLELVRTKEIYLGQEKVNQFVIIKREKDG